MGRNVLEVVLKVTKQNAKAIADLKRDLAGLGQAGSSAEAGLFGVDASLLKIAGTSVAVVAGVAAISKALYDMGAAGAQVERTQDSFKAMASSIGLDASRIVSIFDEMSGGTISDTKAMALATRAMVLNVARDYDSFVKLLRLGAVTARLSGTTQVEAIEDLVGGLGRLSPEVLDNQGIVLSTKRVYEDYAHTLGVTTDALTDAQKKQALLNAAVAAVEPVAATVLGTVRDSAAEYERLSANVENLKDRMNELSSALTADVVPALADFTGMLVELYDASSGSDEPLAIERRIKSLEGLLERYTTSESPFDVFLRGLFAVSPIPIENAIDILNKKLKEAKGAGEGLFSTVDAYLESQSDTAASLYEVVAAENAASSAARGLAQGNDEATDSFVKLASAAALRAKSALASQLGRIDPVQAAQYYDAFNAGIESYIANLERAGYSEKEIEFLVERRTQLYTANVAALGQEEQAVRSVGRATDTLQSKVKSVLSGSLSLDVGVNPDDFLPRPDAVNEDARRLADVVVKGFDSPWASYLAEKFPALIGGAFQSGDIKTAAAQLLRDFQDGLAPQLLDKETAKERVKRMLLGEANMQALAQEITAELRAELGSSVSTDTLNATVATVLGDPTGPGKLVASGFVEGVVTQQPGLKTVSIIDQQIKGQADTVTQSGESTGVLWVGGFIKSIEAGLSIGLVSRIAAVVAPIVLQQLQDENSRGGATD